MLSREFAPLSPDGAAISPDLWVFIPKSSPTGGARARSSPRDRYWFHDTRTGGGDHQGRRSARRTGRRRLDGRRRFPRVQRGRRSAARGRHLRSRRAAFPRCAPRHGPDALDRPRSVGRPRHRRPRHRSVAVGRFPSYRGGRVSGHRDGGHERAHLLPARRGTAGGRGLRRDRLAQRRCHHPAGALPGRLHRRR